MRCCCHFDGWLQQIRAADLREASGLSDTFAGVDAVCWTIGTTAFPSSRYPTLIQPSASECMSRHRAIQLCINIHLSTLKHLEETHLSEPSAPVASARCAAGCGEVCRWKGGNGPKETDLLGFQNLVAALPSSIKRVIFTSSAGVERQDKFPFIILNLFGG